MKDRRFQPSRVAAGALTLAAALTLPLALAPAVLAQSQSGISINNDVLDSLGAGAEAAPLAPRAPAAPPTPLSPRSSTGQQAPAGQAPAFQAQPYQAPAVPPAGGSQDPTFQPYGNDSIVVTRPGTLLFPPLEAPTSTLAPGLTNKQADNNAARSEAMNNAFAEGPEPASQLLIPLDDQAPGAVPGNDVPAGNPADDSVVVFMGNLPPADDSAAAADAPRLTLRRPPMAAPQPAPRKPEVSPDMLANMGVVTVNEPAAALAPEFQAALEVPQAAPLAEVETTTIDDEPTLEPAAEAMAEQAAVPANTMPDQKALADTAPQSLPESTEEEPAADAPVNLLPVQAAGSNPVETPAQSEAASSAEVPAPVAPAPAAESTSPGVQTASLAVGPSLEDMSVSFDSDSAELSDLVQSELRSLASSLRADQDSRIQVLGFASAKGGSQDLARKLALSRALKVRTFLIDAGVPSARIQVRSLGAQSGGGPANRVDIRPIDS